MKTELKHKELGRFFVKKEHVNSKFNKVREVLSKMVIIEARYSAERDVFDYVAICPELFAPIADNEPVPSYSLSFEGKQLVAKKVS